MLSTVKSTKTIFLNHFEKHSCVKLTGASFGDRKNRITKMTDDSCIITGNKPLIARIGSYGKTLSLYKSTNLTKPEAVKPAYKYKGNCVTLKKNSSVINKYIQTADGLAL